MILTPCYHPGQHLPGTPIRIHGLPCVRSGHFVLYLEPARRTQHSHLDTHAAKHWKLPKAKVPDLSEPASLPWHRSLSLGKKNKADPFPYLYIGLCFLSCGVISVSFSFFKISLLEPLLCILNKYALISFFFIKVCLKTVVSSWTHLDCAESYRRYT